MQSKYKFRTIEGIFFGLVFFLGLVSGVAHDEHRKTSFLTLSFRKD